MNIDIPDIYGGATPTLENDYFREATRYVYGLDISGTPSVDTTKRANSLWGDFLVKIGKTNEEILAEVGVYADPTQRTPTQQAALQYYMNLYNDYLLNRLDYVYLSEGANLLSPEEVQSRNILFRTFELILKMLDVLQTNLKLITEAYTLYTKWQNEYSKMMAHTPTYMVNPSKYAIGNLGDIGRSTVGPYSSITVSDTFQYLIDQAVIKNDGNIDPIAWGKKTDQSASTYQNEFSLWKTGNTLYIKQEVQVGNTATKATFFQTSLTATDSMPLKTKADILKALPVLLKQATDIVNSHKTDTNEFINGISWQNALTSYVKGDSYLFTSELTQWSDIVWPTGTEKEINTKAGSRGERNQTLQLYIENTRSKRSVLQNAQKPMEDLMSQCKEALQAQHNLAQTLMDSMKGILSSIFRA